MNKEWIKQLKDAGFPWNENYPCGHCGYDNGSNSPTLSELIEACGDRMMNLERVIDGGIDGKERLWWAGDKNNSNGGETPEEAVANLWLAINKK